MNSQPDSTKPLVANEGLKRASNNLRGTIAADFAEGQMGRC